MQVGVNAIWVYFAHASASTEWFTHYPSLFLGVCFKLIQWKREGRTVCYINIWKDKNSCTLCSVLIWLYYADSWYFVLSYMQYIKEGSNQSQW